MKMLPIIYISREPNTILTFDKKSTERMMNDYNNNYFANILALKFYKKSNTKDLNNLKFFFFNTFKKHKNLIKDIKFKKNITSNFKNLIFKFIKIIAKPFYFKFLQYKIYKKNLANKVILNLIYKLIIENNEINKEIYYSRINENKYD